MWFVSTLPIFLCLIPLHRPCHPGTLTSFMFLTHDTPSLDSQHPSLFFSHVWNAFLPNLCFLIPSSFRENFAFYKKVTLNTSAFLLISLPIYSVYILFIHCYLYVTYPSTLSCCESREYLLTFILSPALSTELTHSRFLNKCSTE